MAEKTSEACGGEDDCRGFRDRQRREEQVPGGQVLNGVLEEQGGLLEIKLGDPGSKSAATELSMENGQFLRPGTFARIRCCLIRIFLPFVYRTCRIQWDLEMTEKISQLTKPK